MCLCFAHRMVYYRHHRWLLIDRFIIETNIYHILLILFPLHLCYCCQLMKLTLELYAYIFKVFLLISLYPLSCLFRSSDVDSMYNSTFVTRFTFCLMYSNRRITSVKKIRRLLKPYLNRPPFLSTSYY